MLIQNRYFFSTAAVLLAGYMTTGYAQTEPSSTSAAEEEPTLGEVVITAQKRTEKLEDVAVAASVVSSDQIATLNAGDISDLNRLVPSVQLNGTINGRVPLGVRGISSVSNEGTVGLSSGVNIMIDGVSIPSDSRDGNALEDVQSVEVLKGPQQTLGGRTAASGEINIVTHQPTERFEGNITAVATTDAEYRGNGYWSGPIADWLEFSLAGWYTDRRFPIENIQLGRHTTEKVAGGRGKLLFKPTEDLDIKLSARIGKDDSDGFNFVYTHVTPGTQLLTGAGGPPFYPSQSQLLGGIAPSMTNLKYSSPVNAFSDVNDRDFGLDIQYHIGGLTLASTTAYQHESQINEQDLFAVSGFFWNILTQGFAPPFFNTQTQFEDIKTFSEELKLVSAVDQPFSYVIGAFYSDTKVALTQQRTLLPALQLLSVTPDTRTTDVYARSTWKFLESTSLITGVRYNYDQIKYNELETADTVSFPPPVIVGPIAASSSSSEGTTVGDISLQQSFSAHSMAYVTYSRGYSPAAYNTAQSLTPTQPTLGRVKKESVNHFEIGAKGTYFDNRLTANVAGFDTKYQNYQVQIFDQSSVAFNPPLILANAGGAETRGIEFDTAFAATRDLRLDLSAAYIDAKFTNYSAAPCYYPTSVAGFGFNPSGCYQVTGGAVVSGSGQASVTGVPVVQNLSGKTLPNSPKFKYSFSAEQRFALPGSLDLVLGGNYTWRSRAQMLVDQNPYGFQSSFGILNLSAGVRDQGGRFSATAFVNNVFNHVYYTDVEDFWSAPWGGFDTIIGQPARDAKTYGGLRVSYHY